MGQSRLIAGAMSGTSADGVDVAIVRVTGMGLDLKAELLAFYPQPYSPELKRAIFAMRESGHAALAELARIGREISLAYAQAVNRAIEVAGVKSSDIAAVAAHGQTLYHAPPDTIQWLDPALIAAQTSCAVVSDFRRADCAAGGQGAPLVPFADYILFRHAEKHRILLNIGGIANLTLIPAGGSIDQLIAFDTGPGNCISDWICRTRLPFDVSFDADGRGAERGRVLSEITEPFLQSDYIKAPPPKSTDGPAMIACFEALIGNRKHETNDLLASAAYITAESIHRAVRLFDKPPNEIIASGGGVHNKAIMGRLRSSCAPVAVTILSKEFRMESAAKEALAFALLAAATLDNFPSNVPSCTGASRKVVLGSITPRP